MYRGKKWVGAMFSALWFSLGNWWECRKENGEVGP